MNKKIYKGYELIKAREDEQIKEGTILIFTSTIAKGNKKEVEVIRHPEGLILYKKDTVEILPTSWLFNSKIEILKDNTEEIEELDKTKETNIWAKVSDCEDKINELVKIVNELRKEKEDAV